jgi:hypothetical protein
MSEQQKTAVDFLVKEFSEILGPLKTEPMQDMLMVDAIKKAKEIFRQQIEDAYLKGSEEIVNLINKYWKFDEFQIPQSGWHDKQALIQQIQTKLMMP